MLMERSRLPTPMHSFFYPARVAGAAIALGLVAAACGAEAATTIDAAPADEQTSSASDEESAVDQAESEGPAADSDDAADSTADADAEPAESDDAAAVDNHLFPDLDTVNIVDGSTLNLAAELAGGDTPILLWFWAPH